MAYLSATDLNDIQSLDAVDEKRYSPLGIVDLAKDSTAFVDYISPSDVEKMSKLSSARDFKFPVIKDQTVVVNTTPGFGNIPNNLPESAEQAYIAVDIFSGFRFWEASYEDNSIDMEWEKKRRMKAVLYAMGKEKETLIAAILEGRKTQQLGFTTQVSSATETYTFSTSTDTLTVNQAAQNETMFYSLENLMAANEVGGNYRIVTNRGGLTRQKAEALKYGAGNDKNLQALGFFGADRMYDSGNISAGSDRFSGYLVRDGGIGLIENFPYDFRANTKFAGREWSITDMEMPWTRSRLNVYVNNEATDATSLVNSSNMIMTNYQEMALWDRFFIVYDYNSDLANRVNPIVKVVGATS